MDVADTLVHEIFSLVDLQKQCADKLKSLAAELEETKKNVNISKVVGSSASVGGSAALAAAGVFALCTGGAGIPLLAAAGAVGSGLGLATSVGSELVGAILSSCTMKEARRVSEEIESLVKEIQQLMESLTEEGKRRKRRADALLPADYVMERTLRAMAKRNGLKLKRNINLITLVSDLSNKKIPGRDRELDFRKKLEMPLLSRLVEELVAKEISKVGLKKAGKEIVKRGVSKAAKSIGVKTSAKAISRVGGGVIGLLISVPELIGDVQNLGVCETDASKNLKEMAEARRTASEEMKTELEEIEKLCQMLADRKKYTQSSARRRWKLGGVCFKCSSSRTMK